MASSRTLATQILQCQTPQEKTHSIGMVITFKLKQEYTPRVLHAAKVVDDLVTLSLDKDDKIRHHKDMWKNKDYSHDGLGKIMKTLNGDQLTVVTRPPESLKN